MHWIRTQLVRIAAGWLVVHFGLLVFVPTTLCASMSANEVGAECTCDHGDGQLCPMHHTRSKSDSSSDEKACSCRSASDPMGAITASLLGPVAVLAPVVSASVPLNAGPSASAFHPQPVESSFPPDSPPPRA